MKLVSSVYYTSSVKMGGVADESVDLIVTSPPYPMIAMWDEIFSDLSGETCNALSEQDGNAAFEHMHTSLKPVWAECWRVLKPGAFACINIGDATRKLGDNFRLYANHARIIQDMTALGLDVLPMIHWFKPTNSPTKFMGSGTLPAGAYVTLEHEYILIFRKGGKRVFSRAEQDVRRRSAFFWEERNEWFSDVWTFKGAGQILAGELSEKAARERSGAFPFELPNRLINMYSIIGDRVLDPFLGTGTTLSASLVNGRSCIGYEIDSGLSGVISKTAESASERAYDFVENRLNGHRVFVQTYLEKKGGMKYISENYGFPVVTRMETDLKFPVLTVLRAENPGEQQNRFEAEYSV